MKLVRSAVAAATCSVLVLAFAPGASADLPTGSTVGFFHTEVGWMPAAPDTSGATGKACTPKLHADSHRPDFNNLVITPTWLSMRETARATAYVAKWECGSMGIIGAFRMTDHPLYTADGPDTTRWTYLYSEDLTRADLEMEVRRNLTRDDPTFTGTIVVEAGAWWGRPDAAGTMVYYPAGCVQQSWLYTIVAWSGTVEAQPYGPEMPCAQPPLPGTTNLL